MVDLLISCPVLLVASPVMLLVAATIKVTTPGPALFRQERVGQGNQPFTIYKFRSMVHQPAGVHENTLGVTRRGDKRMTPIGAFLRASKLDELPQLFNVMRGEMSLVGPRPKLAKHHHGYLPCRPGITGAATLVFSNEEVLLENIPEELVESYTVTVLNPVKLAMDADYLGSATLRTDLAILMKTCLRRANASGVPAGLHLSYHGPVASC